MAGFYDYGPMGVELKNNIKRIWWRDMVQRREDIVGLDCSIISSSQVWEASGHVAGFSDPMVDCKKTKLRYRADQVFWAALESQDSGEVTCYVTVLESDSMEAEALKAGKKKAKALGHKGPFKPLVLKDLTEAPGDIYPLLPSPATGEPGDLTVPRDFNLMFQTSVGALADASATAYLRPETAQGIFTNFLGVQRTARMKVTFLVFRGGGYTTPHSTSFEVLAIPLFVYLTLSMPC